ncbi:hypothetical protein [Piscirickettsia salmonis]|uniref:Uncharacterized protein n=1 Tax=Piscirickettsia salmonis TaxID=1238 RepID=A0A9Q5V7N3_PISSA|nr:hypothetical protein [Piscirickettsia salmonis]APS58901.1 hypothetical protein AVI52_16815 [Piscirickettsia salmonis]PEQ15142.1 hypothetical protein X973_14370 [Piscirickettsia salmonis]QGN79202.1 hypothetical protein Psal001_03467 [Piscirickettsia salmonis]QGN82793.1 hypothetical protein Psal002_03493 [Piscirickettsia salmonis]QGN86305.1 hypothetical protein Psal003_03414 [Piscirickettsia salmonis]
MNGSNAPEWEHLRLWLEDHKNQPCVLGFGKAIEYEVNHNKSCLEITYKLSRLKIHFKYVPIHSNSFDIIKNHLISKSNQDNWFIYDGKKFKEINESQF